MRLLLFTFLLSALSFAQDRNGISYQALIINPNVEQLPGQDNDHSPLTNTDICLQFHIINSSGNYEYSESQSVTTDAYGMVNLVIGTGLPIGANTWDAVAWSAEAKSLRVDIDFSSTCTRFSLLSNQKLNFTPFSYYALNSKADALVASLQGIVDANETASDTADATLQTNIDAVQADVDANETTANTAIAAVQADVDANETASDTTDATLQTNIDAVQADVDANETTANTAIAAVQADVDANETASDTADATLQTNIDAVQADVDANETTANTAIAAVQADVDANETASDTADATLQTNIDAVQADVDANETTANTAIAAVQADVDANETASDTADATLQTNIDAVQADVDANETTANTAIAAVQADVDANETASDTADATLQTNIDAVQADVDANETTANTAIAAVQADVDANETASDTADATLQTNIDAVQADVDANETTANTAIAAVQADVDANETASDTADATLQTNIDAVQADVDANEVASDAAILATINGVGLSSGGNYVSNSQTNYINESTSVVDATEDLDSEILILQNLINALISRVDTLEALHVPEIFLTGDANVNVEVGSSYNDAGATAEDLNDGDISNGITVTGTVDTSLVGIYTLLYDVTDSDGNKAAQVTRTVNVVDTTAPVITLMGYAIVNHQLGTLYTDAGATASDNYYGDITNDIVIVNTVNVDVAGTYTVTYNVSDENNNAATQVSRTVNVVETASYTPTVESGSGNFEESKYLKVGNTNFVFGNFSNASLDSPIKINIPTLTVFSNSNEVNGVISGYMMGMESVGGYIEAVPGTNHVNLSARGAHGMTFDTSGSYIFSYSDNSSGNTYSPSTGGMIDVSEVNYEIVGSTVFVNGNFSNGDFDGMGMTAEISIPTTTVFSNINDVSGIVSGYMMGEESVGGYIEAVPGTSTIKLHVAGAHMRAFDSTGSFVFSYDIDNNASTSYTPTLIGNGTIDTINYFQYGEMIVVNGKFSNLSDGATIILPISSNFTSSTDVSGIITAKHYESFGGYIESVPNSQQVRFNLRGAHGQSTADDGSFYFIYKP